LISTMNSKSHSHLQAFAAGLKDGIPIGLGYIAVSFSLGIFAKSVGLTPIVGFISSFLNHASAGEYSGYLMIFEQATYMEMALVILIANARYLLMGCALTQRIPPQTSTPHRLLMGFLITDEIFAATISRTEKFDPLYTYGTAAVALPLWSLGTALGIQFGTILPQNIVSALSVALYGMFLAVIIPPARASKKLLSIITVTFVCSYLLNAFSGVIHISSGFQIIIITLVISSAAAILFPHEEGNEDE